VETGHSSKSLAEIRIGIEGMEKLLINSPYEFGRKTVCGILNGAALDF
jgi:hypothetical protein